MANNFEYAELFQEVLDEQMAQESVTGWMDENAGLVQYNGGKTVKIPAMTMTGLGNYDRSNGYPAGGVDLSYETFTMTQDRATSFVLDQMDVNETNFVANATNVMAQFQRIWVVPEVDAYRISKIAQAALAYQGGAHVETGYTPSKTDIIEKLADAVEVGGYDSVILATPETVKALEVAIGANNLSAVTFARDGFDQTVPAFNGRPIIKVSPERMVTAIETLTLANGNTGGWKKASGAADINFVVVPRTAPIAIDKLDEPKIFDPEVAQGVSGWKIEYRRYHDCWIMDNAAAGIFLNLKTAPEPEAPFSISPTSLELRRGDSGTITVSDATGEGGEFPAEAFTLDGKFGGITATLQDASSGNAEVVVSVGEGAEEGTGTYTLTYTSGDDSWSKTFTVTVTAA